MTFPRTYPRSDGEPPSNAVLMPWRVGRSVGRTVYAQIAEEASKDDVLIGVMDTPALALEAVLAHNANLPIVVP